MKNKKTIAIGILSILLILGGGFALANHAGYLPNKNTIYAKPPKTNDDSLPSGCITNDCDNNDNDGFNGGQTSNMPEEPQNTSCDTGLIGSMRQRLTMLQNLTWNVYRTTMPMQDVMKDYHSQLTGLGYGPYQHNNTPVQGTIAYHGLPIGYAVYTKGLLIVDAIIAMEYPSQTCILYITGNSFTCKCLLDQARECFPEIFNKI